jgi:thiol-disulfide isomerase/thioredoxin
MRRWVVAISVLALIGCGPEGTLDPGQKPPADTRKAGGKGPVEVTEVSSEVLATALKEQLGTVVLADFWATWCEPCVEGFPHVVGLHKKYAVKGLTCLSVSMDLEGVPGEYKKDKVLDFLKKHEATFPNFILLDPQAIGVRAALEKYFGKGLGIPFSALFARDGKRVWDSRTKRLNDADLETLIEAELAK